MRIVVNDIAASEGGAMSVLKSFYQEILEKNDDNEWIFLLGEQYLEETKNIKVYTFPEIKKSWFKRLLFDFTFGKKVINQFHPDLYFSLQNTATLGVKAKQLVYLHQSLPYQSEKKFSFFLKEEIKYAVYQRIIGKIYNFLFKHSNAQIIVQSIWMQKEVRKLLPNEISLIPPNINIDYEGEFSFEKNPITFFYPAAKLIYKNHEVIFKAVDILVKKGISDFKVVLTIEKCNVKNNQIFEFLGSISQDDVFEYYKNSILLFPSYIETYGLPLKEAQYFGTPIIASKTDFSDEILEGYTKGVFFNKFDDTELASIMSKFIEGKYQFVNSNELGKTYLPNNNKHSEKLVDYITKFLSDSR